MYPPQTLVPLFPYPVTHRRWLFRDDDDTDAYGITSASCLDDLTLGHELGHVRMPPSRDVET